MLAMLLAAVAAAAPLDVPHRAVPPAAAWSLNGRITDSAGQPIAEARVVILEATRSARTDADGRYLLTNVPDGTYGVSFAAIGYRPRVVRVTIRGADARVDVQLERTIVELPAIQTTATPLATSALESPQPLAVLQGGALQSAQAASLGSMLEQLPGMRNLSTGAGIGKPVIRGLTSNRVLVLENGQRIESQQWGDEHAPSVETATAERVEVIRGPASVLYGSDALGGVINVVQRELPDPAAGRGVTDWWASSGYASNGRAVDAAALVEGAQGAFAYRASGSWRTQGDLRGGSAALFNSGLENRSGSGTLGWRGTWGSLTAGYLERRERAELHEDPEEDPFATPFQRIAVSRATLSGNFPLGNARVEVDASRESNRRREFESATDDEFALGLESINTMGGAHLHHSTGGRLAGVVGLSLMRTDVRIAGEEVLVPASVTDNVGVYAFEQVDAGRLQLSFGARFDHRVLRNEASDALDVGAGRQSWNAVTGNAGVLLRTSGSTALVLNAGRGFRAPSAFELFANGVHEGTVRYEVGDPALRQEQSFNVDAAFRMHGHGIHAEIGVFRNAIDAYIHPDPTGEVDDESGLQVYRYVQGNAVLRGIEGAIDAHVARWVHVRGGIDYTHGTNTTTGRPLAFVAPLRVTYAVRVEGDGGVLGERYLEVGGESNRRQRRLDPDDFAPAGYTIVGVSAGASMEVAGRAMSVDLQVRNLLDTAYRSFLSRYKRYADDPGRNVSVRVTLR